MEWLGMTLQKYPELAVYLALGIGYWVGKLKLGGFSLGAVTGSLLTGVLIGYLFQVPVASMAKSTLFLLFLFGIGYSVGPKFFKAMKGDGLRWVILSVFIPAVGLVSVYCMAKILNLDVGFAAGMLSGALTESPAIGTATEAIKALPIAAAEQERLIGHIVVADAICYLFGAYGVILFCSTIGPWLLGINLQEEAKKLEVEYGMTRNKFGVASGWQTTALRAYRIKADGMAVNRTVAEAEAAATQTRLFILGIRRGADMLEVTPKTLLLEGDVVAVIGRSEVLIEAIGSNAEEVADRDLLDVPFASYDVLVMGNNLDGRTLEDIGHEDVVRGVFLRSIKRGEQEIPVFPKTTIERGDILTITGPELRVKDVAKYIGEVVAPIENTDFVTLGLGIFVGALVGLAVVIPIGGLNVTIGTSVGTLIAGLIVGWLRTMYPLFGRIPDAAISFMTSLGLAAFVAMVGLSAGPGFMSAVREVGPKLLLGGAIVTMIPLVLGLYFGRYVLKLNPLLLLGGIAGAQTMTPGMAAVQEKSGSPVAVLGYSGTVAFGHVLLTTWGTVIVNLLA
jgi:putative transport protein